MEKAKVKDHANLIRLGAGIANTDKDAYRRAKIARATANEQKQKLKRIDELEQQVSTLNNKMDLILSLLSKGDYNGNT